MKMQINWIGCFREMLNVFSDTLNNCKSDFWFLKKLYATTVISYEN
jgi:hypothetical protein